MCVCGGGSSDYSQQPEGSLTSLSRWEEGTHTLQQGRGWETEATVGMDHSIMILPQKSSIWFLTEEAEASVPEVGDLLDPLLKHMHICEEGGGCLPLLTLLAK